MGRNGSINVWISLNWDKIIVYSLSEELLNKIDAAFVNAGLKIEK